MSFVLRIVPLLALVWSDVGSFQLLHRGLTYLTHWYPPVSTNRLPMLSHLSWKPVLDPKSRYGVVARGNPDTASYRLYFWDVEGPISPFHDIPIYANEEESILNLIVEIPRWTNAKMEISNEELLNPIKQDFKNGDLRFARNIFPYHGYLWNYGAFPQSWESPNSADSVTGFKGDDDPLDVLEIGTRVGKVGDVVQVKVLGALGFIDEGETDWKIFAIDINDVLATKINDVCDIEKHFPGLIEASVEWLRTYKIPDGKPENMFAFDGKVQNKQFAESVVKRTHEHWRSLIVNPETKSNHSRVSVTRIESPFYMPRVTALNLVAMSTTRDETSPRVRNDDKWYFHRTENSSNCSFVSSEDDFGLVSEKV